MPVTLPPCPASLRSIQFYLKTAQEHDERDPVVSYWCRLWALQSALKIDKSSDGAKVFLMGLMDWLEAMKKSNLDNEAITNEVAAQAHIENYALKLFLHADGQDRAAVFNKNVVKAFFTAGILMDVLAVFGERTEEILANCKYAKWKAAYIHNCLKNGETPVPGPMTEEDDDSVISQQPGPSDNRNQNNNIGFNFDNPGLSLPDPPSTLTMGSGNNVPASPHTMPGVPSNPNYSNAPYPHYNVPANVPTTPTLSKENEDSSSVSNLMAKETGKSLEPEQITKAQKYCKWAISALNYDDVPEAVTNIQKALRLLQTGDES